ncbi:MAG: hypothetical protein JWQ09_304 [Segetibacter sp.]|nr:hypothetical protein [Segetibacter sp.]
MNHSTSHTQTCCCNHEVQETKVENSVLKAKKIYKATLSMLLSLVIAFFPKCPLCWAAYMSMFGSFGVSNVPYMKWLLPVLIAFLGLHLFLIVKKVKEKGYGPFVFSLIGALIILGGKTFLPFSKPVLFAGMLFILSGSLWNSFSSTTFKKSFSHH